MSVISLLQKDVRSGLTSTELRSSPSTLFGRIPDLYHHDPMHALDILRERGRSLARDPDASMQQYLDKHTALRHLMLQTNLPGMSSASTIIELILEGLSYHEDSRHIIRQMRAHGIPKCTSNTLSTIITLRLQYEFDFTTRPITTHPDAIAIQTKPPAAHTVAHPAHLAPSHPALHNHVIPPTLNSPAILPYQASNALPTPNAHHAPYLSATWISRPLVHISCDAHASHKRMIGLIVLPQPFETKYPVASQTLHPQLIASPLKQPD